MFIYLFLNSLLVSHMYCFPHFFTMNEIYYAAFLVFLANSTDFVLEIDLISLFMLPKNIFY